jgi:hypothetical protein
VAVIPANLVTRRLFFEHLFDHPGATGLSGALRLDDDAVSDVSLHFSSLLCRQDPA